MLQVYPEDLFFNSLGLTNTCLIAVEIATIENGHTDTVRTLI